MSRAIRRLGSDERTSQRPCLRLATSGLPIGQPNCTRMRSSPIAGGRPCRDRAANRAPATRPLPCGKTGPASLDFVHLAPLIQYVPEVVHCRVGFLLDCFMNPASLRRRLPWSTEEQDVAVRVGNLEAAKAIVDILKAGWQRRGRWQLAIPLPRVSRDACGR